MASPALVDVRCPLCGGGPGDVVMEEEGYSGRRCAPCGLVFVSPRPQPGEILGIYEHDASQTKARVHVAKAREPFALAHARHLLRLLKAVGEASGARTRGADAGTRMLLEVGAGGGLLLHEARSAGMEVAAVEPNPVLAAFIAESGIACETAPLSPGSFGGRGFDVIVHVNVLSHFYDPLDAMRIIAGRLKPGGLMIMETGNFADVNPRFLPLVQRTERFQLPEHLTFFGERSVTALLAACGLDVVAIHRYSRIPEKVGPRVLRAIGIGRFATRLRFWLKYRVGRWFPIRGRPASLIVIARRPAT